MPPKRKDPQPVLQLPKKGALEALLNSPTLGGAFDCITEAEQTHLMSWAKNHNDARWDGAIADAIIWAGYQRCQGHTITLEEIQEIAHRLYSRETNQAYVERQFKDEIGLRHGQIIDPLAPELSSEVISLRDDVRSRDAAKAVEVLKRLGSGLRRHTRVRRLFEDLIQHPERTPWKLRAARIRMKPANARRVMYTLRRTINAKMAALLQSGDVERDDVDSIMRIFRK